MVARRIGHRNSAGDPAAKFYARRRYCGWSGIGGRSGEGDEFGLGAEESFSILEIAEMFGAEVEMRPETKGNLMGTKLDFSKAHGLGW